MADEVTVVWEIGKSFPFKCNPATAVPKGSVMKLAESMTAIINSGAKDPLAGVLTREKVANDGNSTCSVTVHAICKGVAAAAIAIGAPISISATENRWQTATGTNGATIGGYAMEAPTGVGQTFFFMLNVGAGGEVA